MAWHASIAFALCCIFYHLPFPMPLPFSLVSIPFGLLHYIQSDCWTLQITVHFICSPAIIFIVHVLSILLAPSLNSVPYQATTTTTDRTNEQTEISTQDYANNLRQCVFSNLIKPSVRCVILYLNTQPVQNVTSWTHFIDIDFFLSYRRTYQDKPSTNRIYDGCGCVIVKTFYRFVVIWASNRFKRKFNRPIIILDRAKIHTLTEIPRVSVCACIENEMMDLVILWQPVIKIGNVTTRVTFNIS